MSNQFFEGPPSINHEAVRPLDKDTQCYNELYRHRQGHTPVFENVLIERSTVGSYDKRDLVGTAPTAQGEVLYHPHNKMREDSGQYMPPQSIYGSQKRIMTTPFRNMDEREHLHPHWLSGFN